MINKKTFISAALFFLIAALAWASGDYLKDRYKNKIKQESYAQIIPLIGIKQDDDFFTTVDKVRMFLFKHSQYSEDEDFHEIWGDHPKVAQSIIDHAEGLSGKRAPLECSSRSGALESILITLGYNVRSVAVYAYGENYISHTFSEVQNPETGRWHAQDVQFNIYWRMKDSGKRASVKNLISRDVSDYEPCRTPKTCGWDLPNREGSYAKNLTSYFGLASIKDYQRDKRPLLVNTSRFKLNKPQMVEGALQTYCEWINKNCREEIIRFE